MTRSVHIPGGVMIACDHDIMDKKGKGTGRRRFTDLKTEGITKMAEKENQTVGNFSKLLTVSNQVEAGMVEELLKNEQIACYRRDRELGSFLRVSMGYSVYGEDIFVSKDQLENAREVLKDSFLAVQEDQDGQDEEYADGKESDVTESYDRRRRLAARIVVIVLAAIMMLVLLLSLIH